MWEISLLCLLTLVSQLTPADPAGQTAPAPEAGVVAQATESAAPATASPDGGVTPPSGAEASPSSPVEPSAPVSGSPDSAAPAAATASAQESVPATPTAEQTSSPSAPAATGSETPAGTGASSPLPPVVIDPPTSGSLPVGQAPLPGAINVTSGPAQSNASSVDTTTAPNTVDPNYWLKFGLAALVFVVPILLGPPLAQAFKLPDAGFRFTLVLFSLLAGLVCCIFGWPPKLGVDLAGGTILVYELGGEQQFQPTDNNASSSDETLDADSSQSGKQVDMQKLADAIRRRVDPAGVKEIAIRRRGEREVEIIMPRVERAEVEDIKRLISKEGLLEFRIAANPLDDKTEHQAAIRLADAQPGSRVVVDATGKEIARWVKLDPGQQDNKDGYHMRLVGNEIEVLVLKDNFDVTGAHLVRAVAGFDRGPEVQFRLNGEGSRLFSKLTGRNIPDPATGLKQRLCVVLDNEIESAPSLESQISDSGVINGISDRKEVEFIVKVLNAGSLPTSLNPQPLSEETISPTLGQDTIDAGLGSMYIASGLVVLFMLIYYHFAGFVACLVLMLNLLLVVASMIAIKAAFTLPGLAGLVLTVGMAVDSNVLIYERIREELLRGSGLRMAIRNGFSAATGTIIDSNLTTLIVAVVLFFIGTDQIKGFAVTLILGLALSMFTAVYVARLIFDVCERNRWITSLSMFRMLTKSNFDFVGNAPIFMTVSVVLLLIGIGAVFARGWNILDIDFNPGSSVHVLFREPVQIADVRKVLEGVKELPSSTVVSVGGDNREYKIDSQNTNSKAVEQRLAELFGEKLERNAAKLLDLQPIAGGTTGVNNAAPSPPPLGSLQRKQSWLPGILPGSEWSLVSLLAPQEGGAATTQVPVPEVTVPQIPAVETPAVETSAVETSAVETPAVADPAVAAPATPAAPTTAEPPPEAAGAGASTDSVPMTKLEPSTPVSGEKVPAGSTAEAPASNTAAGQAAGNVPAAANLPAVSLPSVNPGIAPANVTGGAGVVPRVVDVFAGGSTGKVQLGFPLNHDSLKTELNAAAAAANLPVPTFSLNGPGYVPGSGIPLKEWEVKLAMPVDQANKLFDALNTRLTSAPVFPTSSSIGANVASDTQIQAINALLLSLALIIIYVWFRFSSVAWGIAGVVALVHDVLMMLGFIALSYYFAPYLGFLLVDPFKISLTIVAAFLTIIGYSINDTIVIFDRMREVKGKSPFLTAKIINDSLNQTLSRTVITSLTVFLVVVPLYVLGGQGIHGFAFALLIGVIFGSYSSLFIAAPLVLWATGQQTRARAG